MSYSKRLTQLSSVVLFSLVSASLIPLQAQAADPIVLKVASPWADNHPANVNGPEFFMKQMEQLSHGAVKFEWYPTAQLGSPLTMLQLLENGSLDMSLVAASYTPSQLPLIQVGSLPGMGTTSCQISRAMQEVASPDGVVGQSALLPKGIHSLFAGSPPPYDVMTTKTRIEKRADLRGLRLKSTGGPVSEALKALGAVPVQMSSNEVYQAVKSGILDGRIGPYPSVKSLHETKIFKYGTIGAGVGNFAALFAISEKRWNSLPKNIQSMMIKVAQETQTKSCEYWDSTTSKTIAELKSQDHWQFYTLKPAQKQRWLTIMDPIQQEWAKTMDSKGLKGTATLQAMRTALKAQ